MVKLTKHHRRCKSQHGTNDRENISFVPEKQHRAYHQLFENKTPQEVCQILNAKWLDPQFKLVCVESDKYTRAIKLIGELT